MAALEAMGTPIAGEAGIGYVMRKGYDLPLVNFDADEAEAVALGLVLPARTGDPGSIAAAGRAGRKLREAAPGDVALFASSFGASEPEHTDMSLLRAAICDERKLRLAYRAVDGDVSARVVRPIAMIY